MSAQEMSPKAISVIAKHLAKQRRRSVDREDCCRYRGPNGTMCAVGCLIPDDVYDEENEFMPVHLLNALQTNVHPVLASFFDEGTPHSTVLRALAAFQNWHDRASFFKLDVDIGVQCTYEQVLTAHLTASTEELEQIITQYLTTIYRHVTA